MKTIDPIALFRLSVLGALTSAQLERGELKQELERLAQRHYEIPHSKRTRISAKTIEGWYYRYLRHGVEGLAPKPRTDQGASRIEDSVQQKIIAAKQENPSRSIRTLVRLMEDQGTVKRNTLSRSAVHRLLKRHGISRKDRDQTIAIERRSFEASHAGDIWYGDVMHGPKVLHNGKLRKSYLVSLMDDASRLVPHSRFCLAETAVEIEGVLKQALLKRGLPRKLVVDNGAAYRSESLQGICARLGIDLIYCRPYSPQGKAKLERWHRTVRNQFLTELPADAATLEWINSRWWGWLEQHYHTAEHSVLGCAPIVRYQQDLEQIRDLGELSRKIDRIFCHQVQRTVRKDGSISYLGKRYEVDYLLSGKSITLLVDPHNQMPLEVLDDEGEMLCKVTLQDKQGNRHRKRRRAKQLELGVAHNHGTGETPVDLACKRHYGEEV